MKSVLLTVVLLAAFATIASGVWVARALLIAISEKRKPSVSDGA